ncbi:ABC transporter permease [Rhodanobacter sp. Col0626]|uniref:ABC transporter permease n=1 Tax=Rhodanobacter sp. Col0626 TaxID=3415679 RepID=UPI003CFAB403
MFDYYLRSAFRKSLAHPWLTVATVLIVGLGVAACMTTLSVLRAATRDPIPSLSASLYAPAISTSGQTQATLAAATGLADYDTAQRLLGSDRNAVFADYALSGIALPQQSGLHPMPVNGHAVSTSFFSMLDVPFAFGAPWSATEEDQREPLVVISSRLNNAIFSGRNSVGSTLRYNDSTLRIVGVLRDWDPQPRFYDVNAGNGYPGTDEDFFVPLQSALSFQWRSSGTVACIESPDGQGFKALLGSSCLWLSLIAKASTQADLGKLDRALESGTGKFAGSGAKASARMIPLRSLLESKHIVPDGVRSSVAVSIALFIGCLVTVASLMMSNYIGRLPELGLRRALGARKGDIFRQLLVEAGVIGALGGAVGIALTFLGVATVHRLLPSGPAQLAALPASSVALALLGAMITTLISGGYPALSAARVMPFRAIKQG